MTTTCSTWKPSIVRTIDGRDVLSDSEEFRACCEAVYSLSRPQADRKQWLDSIQRRRGPEGLLKLEAEMNRIEPAYLLAMPNRDARRAYLDQTEIHRGKVVRKDLEQRIVALWEKRKAASTAAASAPAEPGKGDA